MRAADIQSDALDSGGQAFCEKSVHETTGDSCVPDDKLGVNVRAIPGCGATRLGKFECALRFILLAVRTEQPGHVAVAPR
jgi:hypothetical protein